MNTINKIEARTKVLNNLGIDWYVASRIAKENITLPKGYRWGVYCKDQNVNGKIVWDGEKWMWITLDVWNRYYNVVAVPMPPWPYTIPYHPDYVYIGRNPKLNFNIDLRSAMYKTAYCYDREKIEDCLSTYDGEGVNGHYFVRKDDPILIKMDLNLEPERGPTELASEIERLKSVIAEKDKIIDKIKAALQGDK